MEQKELKEYLDRMLNENAVRIIAGKQVRKDQKYKKLVAEKKEKGYQLASYTEQQVFHENIAEEEVSRVLSERIADSFLQVNGFSDKSEHILLISKKGKLSCKVKRRAASEEEKEGSAGQMRKMEPRFAHNRQKNYLLQEGRACAPLVDMGIFTRDGKVVRSMYDKFRQINRFLEILDDEIGKFPGEVLHIIDFGCGKSYLTFIVYYYLTEIRGIRAEIVGLDLKTDVIEKCNEAARRYGYEGLRFERGDINGYQAPFAVDMVLTLHACDTATDHALYNAVCWNAKMIFSVPCCQHELNGQMQPENLKILSRYGILKERFAAIATDAIRGNLLEYCGYKTAIMEFVDLSHTPKNVLIRAVKRASTDENLKQKVMEESRKLMEEFGFAPTLYRLLSSQNGSPD